MLTVWPRLSIPNSLVTVSVLAMPPTSCGNFIFRALYKQGCKNIGALPWQLVFNLVSWGCPFLTNTTPGKALSAAVIVRQTPMARFLGSRMKVVTKVQRIVSDFSIHGLEFPDWSPGSLLVEPQILINMFGLHSANVLREQFPFSTPWMGWGFLFVRRGGRCALLRQCLRLCWFFLGLRQVFLGLRLRLRGSVFWVGCMHITGLG